MKRFLCLVTVLALVLSLLPGLAMAEFEPVVLSESTVYFDSYDAAFEGNSVPFTTETNGDVTVQILGCTNGYYIDIYEDGEWVYDYVGSAPLSQTNDEASVGEAVTFSVTAGVEYEVLLCSYDLDADDFAPGFVSYKITFLSNGETPEPEDPELLPGATAENPLPCSGSWNDFIAPGQTVWFLYDNTQNMEENNVYSMMLHISSGSGYSATFAGEELPVDEMGFLNYEMKDTEKTGFYLFSVTNNLAEKKFFSITVKEKPIYIIADQALVVGRNTVTLDSDYPYTLYEFSPSRTGIYQIRVAQGRVGDFGTVFNPMDNTANKTNTLIWTCTAVGQSVLVGITGPKSTTCTIIRTGDYVPPVEVPWTVYENTYDFSYVLDANAEALDIDLTDGGAHTAVLGADGFYHYGSAEGALMVANLSSAEINFSDAYLNGGLRVWLQDENQETLLKVDYNEAMNQYLEAGLVPVTAELAMMLQTLGDAGAWWNANGMIFGDVVPEDTSIAWMQLCAYLVEDEGVTLSGAVISGAEGDVDITLIAEGEVIATASGLEGTYALEGVTEGTYTLRVSQLNHVTREYTVTVGEEDVTQDVKIHLIGDIDGNGKINVGDVSKLNSHLKGTSKITDEYMLLCANVNGGSLNMGDTAALYGHIKGTKALY